MSDKNILKVVIQDIRGRIISGMWPPGTQVPTRGELAVMMDTSPATVQMAIHALVSEGSVVTRKRAGTFIADHPPELGLFVLAIAKPMGDLRFKKNLFHEALTRAAACVAVRHPGWQMEVCDAHDARLDALVRSQALAGLLYSGGPEKNPAYGLAHIPQASFYYPGQHFIHGLNILMDNHKLLDCGIRALRQRNYTQLSVLSCGALMRPDSEAQPLGKQVLHLAEKIRDAGGAYRPDWVQNPEVQNTLAAYQLIRLMMGNPLDRPQAVILMDDHLLSPVRQAINDLGLRIPQDVAICMLSHERPQTMNDPYIRIGFDTEDFVMKVVTRLSHLRQINPGPTTLDVEFEELTFLG